MPMGVTQASERPASGVSILTWRRGRKRLQGGRKGRRGWEEGRTGNAGSHGHPGVRLRQRKEGQSGAETETLEHLVEDCASNRQHRHS